MLINTEKVVNEIAVETGFASAVSFARVFKKYTQLPPGKYRERCAGEKIRYEKEPSGSFFYKGYGSVCGKEGYK